MKKAETENKVEQLDKSFFTMQQIEEDMKVIEMNGVKVRKPAPESIPARQLHYFAEQPKVRYHLPRSQGDPKGAFEPYQVNDLMVTVEKGKTVSIPQDIADGFDAAFRITDAAINKDALKDVPDQLMH
jgi:hypothetical protein